MKMVSSKLFRQKKMVVCVTLVLVLFVSSATAMAFTKNPPRMLTEQNECEPYELCVYSGGCYYCYNCICEEDGENYCVDWEFCEDSLEMRGETR